MYTLDPKFFFLNPTSTFNDKSCRRADWTIQEWDNQSENKARTRIFTVCVHGMTRKTTDTCRDWKLMVPHITKTGITTKPLHVDTIKQGLKMRERSPTHKLNNSKQYDSAGTRNWDRESENLHNRSTGWSKSPRAYIFFKVNPIAVIEMRTHWHDTLKSRSPPKWCVHSDF